MRTRASVMVGLMSLSVLACHHASGAGLAADARRDDSAASCPQRGKGPGSDVPPRLVHLGALTLSESARADLLGAHAVVEVMVDAEGRPVPCTFHVLTSPDPRLSAAARTALLTSQYVPATLQGRPVSMWIRQPVEVR